MREIKIVEPSLLKKIKAHLVLIPIELENNIKGKKIPSKDSNSIIKNPISQKCINALHNLLEFSLIENGLEMLEQLIKLLWKN